MMNAMNVRPQMMNVQMDPQQQQQMNQVVPARFFISINDEKKCIR